MRRFDNRWLWGGLLVLVGVILLIQNLGLILFPIVSLVWGLIFVAAGVVFLSVVIADRKQWWAIIPGLVLIGIAALIILGEFFPGQTAHFGGPLFLAAISLAFWIVFFLNPVNWWAIIPGGTLLTLAIVASAGQVVQGPAIGGIFFLGLGLTFGLLALINTPNGRLRWALIPAGIMLAMGFLISLAASSILNFIWPVVLILIGLYFLFFRTSSRQ